MQIIEVDPKNCTRWAFADRSGFEFGDVFELGQDIIANGQVEPVILRKPSNSGLQYEVIAGSRRWKACLEAGINLKGIVQELSDEQASVVQIKENQQLSICDYSKGLYYSKLLAEKKTSRANLAKLAGCSPSKLDNFLTFERIPATIWEAVGNPSRVSSRSAATILALSQKGDKYLSALIHLAEDIRKGAGSRTLEQKVLEAVNGKGRNAASRKVITLPSGIVIANWADDGIKFAKNIPFNHEELEKIVVDYFQKTLVENQSENE